MSESSKYYFLDKSESPSPQKKKKSPSPPHISNSRQLPQSNNGTFFNNFNITSITSSKSMKEDTLKISPIKLSTKLLKFEPDIKALELGRQPNEKYAFAPAKLYEALGSSSKSPFTTQLNNLRDKLGRYFKKEKDEEEKQIEKEDENLELEDELAFENRYFIQNPSIFCFRCHKSGHFQRSCPDPPLNEVPFCLVCLSENHSGNRCEDFICFKCLKNGHMAKDCPLKDCANCYKCRKKGHKEINCGVLTNNWENTEMNKVRCLYCGKKGHSNCFEFKKVRDSVYRSKKSKKKEKYNDQIDQNNRYSDDGEIIKEKRKKKIKKNKKR